jgi:hypothetical protein
MIAVEIRAAVKLVENGEGALAIGDIATAALLHQRADCSCASIIRDLCHSADAEAEFLEPAFTELETKLLRLGTALEDSVYRSGF